MPAHNAAAVLERCTAALEASDLPRADWELIAVDDASTDSTSDVARGRADTVVRLDGRPHGPAAARNAGAEVARADVLAFIDADVCVHHPSLRRLLETLDEDPGITAVFGAYDEDPVAPGTVSQYRNLLHHYVHVQHAGEADTFWAGCGAIRRAEFLRAGGFDAARYPRPQIEDIALGYRLRAAGARIVLRPDIQATHLKRWTLGNMVRNDLLDRGVPWMELLLEKDAVGTGALNVRQRERVLTGIVALAVPFIAAAVVTRSGVWLAAAAGCLLVPVLADVPLTRWFARRRGVAFALRTIPLRLLYYILNVTAVAIAGVRQLVGRRWRARLGAGRPVQRHVL